jgi:acetolactate synthase I/II/III large subunit
LLVELSLNTFRCRTARCIVDFGPVNFVKLAESFGAAGLKTDHPDEIAPTLKKALAMEGPVVVAIPVDYRDNHRLMEILLPDVLN